MSKRLRKSIAKVLSGLMLLGSLANGRASANIIYNSKGEKICQGKSGCPENISSKEIGDAINHMSSLGNDQPKTKELRDGKVQPLSDVIICDRATEGGGSGESFDPMYAYKIPEKGAWMIRYLWKENEKITPYEGFILLSEDEFRKIAEWGIESGTQNEYRVVRVNKVPELFDNCHAEHLILENEKKKNAVLPASLSQQLQDTQNEKMGVENEYKAEIPETKQDPPVEANTENKNANSGVKTSLKVIGGVVLLGVTGGAVYLVKMRSPEGEDVNYYLDPDEYGNFLSSEISSSEAAGLNEEDTNYDSLVET